MNNYIIQLIGIIAVFLWVISVHYKEQYKILFLQALANLVYTIQYALLGVFSAASMNFLSLIRCYIFYRKRKQKEDISKLWLIVFILLGIILGILTYDNYLSLIPIIITLFYIISSWMKNSTWIRIVFLIAAFIWVYYNYTVGAYVCIIGNILEIISGISSIIRFSVEEDNNKAYS